MAVTRRFPFDLAPIVSADEHLFLLRQVRRSFRLLRKDDLLDEGVAALFGVVGAEAELLGLCFQVTKFSPEQVAAWLAERIFTRPINAAPLTGSTHLDRSPDSPVVLDEPVRHRTPKEEGHGGRKHSGGG